MRSAKSSVEISKHKRAAFFLITLLLVGGIVEIIAALGTLTLTRRGWMAYVPHLSKEQINDYLRKRSPQLGWGPMMNSSGKIVRLSPRSDPTFAEARTSCVSIYGDSFTFGGKDDATYPYYLALALRCPVANFGVVGYGSDQALMLFQSQSDLDQSPIVVLGHLSENILRNVNQYRNLLYPGSELGFKPRFILEQNRLRYVPIPINNPDDYQMLEEHPDAKLPFDAFVDRPRRSFPYSIALLRWLITDFQIRAKLTGIPRHAPFYVTDHPAQGLQLTTQILASFVDEAHAHGKKAIILLIPTGSDLIYAQKTGLWTDQPLMDDLARRGVIVIHAGPTILARLNGADPCLLFEDCSGHFNDSGYKMLADILAEEIQSRGLLN